MAAAGPTAPQRPYPPRQHPRQRHLRRLRHAAAALNNPAAAGPAASSGGLEPRLKRLVRPVRGFPSPDSTFLDITPLLADGAAFSETIRALADRYRSAGLAAIAGVEARGLLFAPAVGL